MSGDINELIDFSCNEDTIEKDAHVDSILLHGDPDAIPGAEITIGIPTYKRPHLLKEAIDSALDQKTDAPYRIVVVDNDPDFNITDTLETVKSFNSTRITYYKNKASIQSWNRCIVLAKTKWCALLHDDDLLLDNYIDTVSNIMKKHKRPIDGLYFSFKDNNPPHKKGNSRETIKKIISFFKNFRRIKKIPIYSNMYGNNFGPPSCGITFNRRCFIESGGFDMSPLAASDWRFLIYFSEKYDFYKANCCVGIYRWMENATLREDVSQQLVADNKKIILSLAKSNPVCKLIYYSLKNDYRRIFSRKSVWERMETSLMYKIGYILFHHPAY
jgi:glycosyltransferase involved in cell wall biosynthesis